MPEPVAPTPPAESPLPEYLAEFLGQFLTDPQRVNPQLAGEFLCEFYVRAAQAFPAAREYAESQLAQIDRWRSELEDPAGD